MALQNPMVGFPPNTIIRLLALSKIAECPARLLGEPAAPLAVSWVQAGGEDSVPSAFESTQVSFSSATEGGTKKICVAFDPPNTTIRLLSWLWTTVGQILPGGGPPEGASSVQVCAAAGPPTAMTSEARNKTKRPFMILIMFPMTLSSRPLLDT